MKRNMETRKEEIEKQMEGKKKKHDFLSNICLYCFIFVFNL